MATTIQIAHVDLSALPAFPERARAVSELHRTLDPWYVHRMAWGAALKPCEYQVHAIAPGLLQVTRVKEGE